MASKYSTPYFLRKNTELTFFMNWIKNKSLIAYALKIINNKDMNFLAYSEKQQENFENVPLNPVDLLVLSWLSYFDFRPVIDNMPFKIKELKEYKYYHSLDAYADSFLTKKSRKMMRNVVMSNRFQDMELLDYQLVFDKKRAIQFAALAVNLDHHIIIAYKGTDPSYIGWKEDFFISYKESLDSYSLAKDFYQRVVDKYQGPVILCGHSKGGHIATYVLTSIADTARIQLAYSFDGPGFRENVFKGKEDLLKVYHKVVPQSSLVGVLFTNEEETEIIKSRNIMVFQHNPFEWQVRDNNFIPMKKRTYTSRYLDRAINGWIESIDDQEKEKFTNILFDAFENDFKAKDFNIFLHKFLLQGGPAWKAYLKLNKEDRKLFNSVVRRLIKNFIRPKKIEKKKD